MPDHESTTAEVLPNDSPSASGPMAKLKIDLDYLERKTGAAVQQLASRGLNSSRARGQALVTLGLIARVRELEEALREASSVADAGAWTSDNTDRVSAVIARGAEF